MEIEIVRPEEIEKRSFAIISEELKAQGITLPEDQEAVTKRCIHTSADFDYARNLTFSEGAVEKAKEAIRHGASIVTDTQMAPVRQSIKGYWSNTADKYTASCRIQMWQKERRGPVLPGPSPAWRRPVP